MMFVINDKQNIISKREKFFKITSIILLFLLVSLIALSQDKINIVVSKYKWYLLVVIIFVGFYFILRKSFSSKNDIYDITRMIKEEIHQTSGYVLNTTTHNVKVTRLMQNKFIVEFYKEGLVFYWDDTKQKIIRSNINHTKQIIRNEKRVEKEKEGG